MRRIEDLLPVIFWYECLVISYFHLSVSLLISSSPAFRKHILSFISLAEHPAFFHLKAYPEGTDVLSALQHLQYPLGHSSVQRR